MTERTIDLGAVMARWSKAGARFTPETLRAYSTETHGLLNLHACATCGFARFHPVVAGDSDFYAAITATDYYNAEKWEFDRAEAILAGAQAESVIDIGCGPGLFLDRLRQRSGGAVSLVGVEINEAAAKVARANNFTVHVRNFARAEFDNLTTAAAVCAFQVLEHVIDPIAFLTGLRKLATPAGLVLVGVPDAQGLIAKYWDALTELPPHHVSYWTENSLRAAFRSAGLDFISIEREPLSGILWDGYYPDVWASGAWPSRFGRAAAKLTGVPQEGMKWVAETLSAAGAKALYGVGGHSMLAVGRASR